MELKRIVDITGGLFGLVVGAPLLAIVAVGVRASIGGPVFFSQVRPGRHSVPFRLVKFRTMTDERDARGLLLPDELRLSRFGRFLRSTSLDELPEFWNVLRGEMSLVGPRPLLTEYLPLYSPEQAQRHAVRPGMTGLAQVYGRNAISWEERFRLDVLYIREQSFWLDLKILALTILRVFSRRDINQPGEATIRRFEGTPTEEGS